jgi:hypothetical protein
VPACESTATLSLLIKLYHLIRSAPVGERACVLGTRAHLRVSATGLVCGPIRTTSAMGFGSTIASYDSDRRPRRGQNGILPVTMSFAIVKSPRKL